MNWTLDVVAELWPTRDGYSKGWLAKQLHEQCTRENGGKSWWSTRASCWIYFGHVADVCGLLYLTRTIDSVCTMVGQVV